MCMLVCTAYLQFLSCIALCYIDSLEDKLFQPLNCTSQHISAIHHQHAWYVLRDTSKHIRLCKRNAGIPSHSSRSVHLVSIAGVRKQGGADFTTIKPSCASMLGIHLMFLSVLRRHTDRRISCVCLMQAVYDQMVVLEKGVSECPPLCINVRTGAVLVLPTR